MGKEENLIENLKKSLEDKLNHHWISFAQLIFSKRQGIEEFNKWLQNNEWNNELQLSSDLRDRYNYVINLYSIQQVRLILIENQFYTFRKNQLDKLVQQTLESFSSTKIEQISTESNAWSLLLYEIKQNIFHEFNVQINAPVITEIEQSPDDWINKWLTKPHFNKYKQFINSIPDTKTRKNAIDKAIKALQMQLHHEYKRVFFQIIMYHGRYQDGIYELQKYTDPHHFCEEEVEFITLLVDNNYHAAPPLLHQIIEKLIIKKTRSHYIQAVKYIILLRTLYNDKQSRFDEYIEALRSKYNRYTSFMKELDNHVK